MIKLENILIGSKFNRLRYIGKAENDKRNKTMWICKCDCGTIKNIQATQVKNQRVLSCGCLKDEGNRKTHGLRKHRLYKIHSGMRQRCYNENNTAYKNYGGRGITVCDEWKNDFQSFYDWSMENGYQKGLSIDRINNDGNYEPSNCRWVDTKTNNNNKRNVHYVTYKNKTQSLMSWCEELDLDYGIISSRIVEYGWDIERAFTTKSRKYDKVVYDGKEMTVSELAKELGLNYDTLRSRLFRYGWSLNRAINTTASKNNARQKRKSRRAF